MTGVNRPAGPVRTGTRRVSRWRVGAVAAVTAVTVPVGLFLVLLSAIEFQGCFIMCDTRSPDPVTGTLAALGALTAFSAGPGTGAVLFPGARLAAAGRASIAVVACAAVVTVLALA